MIRGFFRMVGLLFLAGGFIFLVYDGARSIADQALRVTQTGEFWNDINQVSQQAAKGWLNDAAPWLWRLVSVLVLDQPVWAVMAGFALVLLLVFRRPRALIGYSRN
jgi:hypothetical protein